MHLMRRLAPGLLALTVVLAACGGGDDDDSTPANSSPTPSQTATGGDGTATASVSPTATPESQLPTPTPLADDIPILQVAAGGQLYEPLTADFESLPQETIDVGGQDYTGVLIDTLALKVPADPQSVVTIEGTRSDGLRFGVIRFPLDDIGSTTVLMLAENGHLDLISSSIPRDQWLTSVTSVAFE
jgi:hypothetical protein